MEFGGYLPLELDEKNEYFISNENYSVVPLNNGRTAIWYAVEQFNVKKIALPLFYCPTVIDMLGKEYELLFYRLDDNFLPIIDGIVIDDNTAVILVNYYGVFENILKPLVEKYKNVIIDNAHSFFTEPILKSDVYNIYSCRKFIGVADGAYLISEKLNKEIELNKENSFDRYKHLLKSIETGTSSAYDLNLENESYIGNTKKYMSKLTQRILKSVDYQRIRERRIINFNTLHSLLKPYQKITNLLKDFPAYCYPLYLSKDIRNSLIENKIWVPTMWRELIVDDLVNSNEYNFSKYIACLPVDQRYTRDDMIELSKIVINCINN